MSSDPSWSKASVHTEGPAEAEDDVVEEEAKDEDAEEALEVIDDGVDVLLMVVELACGAVLGDGSLAEGLAEGELSPSSSSAFSLTSSALFEASSKSDT